MASSPLRSSSTSPSPSSSRSDLKSSADSEKMLKAALSQMSQALAASTSHSDAIARVASIFANGRYFVAPTERQARWKRLQGRTFDKQGNIGAGKSELVKAVGDALAQEGVPHKIIPERFNKTSLDLFYGDKQRYAYPFQTEQRDHCIAVHEEAAREAGAGKIVVKERGMWANVLFAQLQVFDGNISHDEFLAYLTPLLTRAPYVSDLCVYIYSPPRACLENIRLRGREAEIKGIKIDYLERLDLVHYVHLHAQIVSGCTDAIVIFNEPYCDAADVLDCMADDSLPKRTRELFAELPPPSDSLKPDEIEARLRRVASETTMLYTARK